MTTQEHIIALEREALDGWSGGNAVKYLVHAADDITYFDDIGANTGLTGIDAVTEHFHVVASMVPEHHYEMVGTNFQDLGDNIVLMFNYHPTTLEGEPSTKWRATVVYTRRGDDWKVVHAHWTMHKDM